MNERDRALAEAQRAMPRRWDAWDSAWAAFFVLLLAFVVSSFQGCSHPINSRVVQCKLSALEELPDEPEAVTIGDVVRVVNRFKGCKADGADAGDR